MQMEPELSQERKPSFQHSLNSDSLGFAILTATEAGFYVLWEGFVCKKTSNIHLNSYLYPSQFINQKWDRSDIAIQKVSIRKNNEDIQEEIHFSILNCGGTNETQ